MAGEILVTKEGLEKMRAELAELRGSERARIAEAIKEAKSHGDLRENAAYHEAKLNQRRLDSRIADLEKAIMRAKVVQRPDNEGDIAHLGSKVVLEDKEFADEFEIILVGSFEADPSNNRISITSPLGEALLGKVVGDEVQVEAPGGMQQYAIRKIQ